MQVQAAAQKLQDLEQKLQQGEKNMGGSSSSSSSNPLVQQRLACLARERDDALTRLALVSGACPACPETINQHAARRGSIDAQ